MRHLKNMGFPAYCLSIFALLCWVLHAAYTIGEERQECRGRGGVPVQTGVALAHWECIAVVRK